jgi:hypothetical protein
MKNIKRLAVLFVLIIFTVAAILWLNSSNDKKDASKEEGVLETKTDWSILLASNILPSFSKILLIFVFRNTK